MGSPPNSSKAVTALVLGILGLVVCGPLGIAAIVVGNQATREIATSGGREGGEGLAKAGVVLGWIAVALMALGLLLVVFIVAAGAMSSG
jgi:hypothetical protein